MTGRDAPSETRPFGPVTLAALAFGESSAAGRVSFERKTADDLGRSIIDGSLFQQRCRPRRLTDRPARLFFPEEQRGRSMWPGAAACLDSWLGHADEPTDLLRGATDLL